MSWQKLSAWIGAVVAVPSVVAVIFWGLPYYLDHSVDTRFDAYIEKLPEASTDPAVTQNGATIQAVKEQLNSMELRMIERDRIQAERDAVIMQYFQDQASN